MPKRPIANATVRSAPGDHELDVLTARRETLVARKNELDAASTAAVSKRRDVLINGTDAAVSAEAERACREAEGTALAAADALAEIDRRIADVEASIAADELRAQREVAAGDLEQSANAIERAASVIEKAVAALADAHGVLVAAISTGAAEAVSPTHADGYAAAAATVSDFSPEGIAERLTLGALVAAIPGMNVVDGKAHRPAWMPPATIEPSNVRQAAGEIAAAVRTSAGAVRSGQTNPAVAVPAAQAAPSFDTCSEAEVCVTAAFKFLWKGRTRTMVTPGKRRLKTPIADAAVAQGLATRDLDEAKRLSGQQSGALAAAFTHTGATRWDECADLQFDFDAWAAEAKQRFNAGLPVAA